MRLMPAPSLPTPPARQRFRRRLLAWYRANGRDLPWRHTSDPYHILVSEMMLQQTQVDRVLPKYHEWLHRYPSLAALATADEGDVTNTWRPLGYNIRPRRLHAIARESMERYGGELPSDEETLLSLRASAPTRPAQSEASHSGNAPRSSIPTLRACFFASSSAAAIQKRTPCANNSGLCQRRSCRTSTSSTSTRD